MLKSGGTDCQIELERSDLTMFEDEETTKADRNSKFDLIVKKVELWTVIISVVVLLIAYSGHPQNSEADKPVKDVPKEQTIDSSERD